jgi:hypothetical protein
MTYRTQDCWAEAEGATGVEAALWAIAAALCENADATMAAARHLGTGNAATQMGALEALGLAVTQAAERIADAMDRGE